MGVLALMEIFRPSHGTVRFGDFELDQDTGELRRGGVKIRLQEQPLQMLQILLEQPGKMVAREELQKRIWSSDTFVDFDHGINNAIKRLREALADTAETPRYIETLPRRGYRFIKSVNAVAQPGPGRIRSVAVLPLENLSGDPEQEYFARVQSVHPEAYEVYLKGRYYANQRSAEELAKAVQCFEAAITKDPAYAAAYAGLADSLATFGTWGFAPPHESCGKAKGFA